MNCSYGTAAVSIWIITHPESNKGVSKATQRLPRVAVEHPVDVVRLHEPQSGWSIHERSHLATLKKKTQQKKAKSAGQHTQGPDVSLHAIRSLLTHFGGHRVGSRPGKPLKFHPMQGGGGNDLCLGQEREMGNRWGKRCKASRKQSTKA